MNEDINNKKRLGVFIDGSNLWHCQKRNGWLIDFRKLKSFFARRGEVEGLYYFTPDAPHLQRFLRELDKIGYNIIKKPMKEIKIRQKGTPVSFKYKGNLDMEMGLLIATNINAYDEFILVSGDSDFEVVIKMLANKGKNVVVICNKSSLSVELRRSSNQFIYLHKIKREIKYKKSQAFSPGLTPHE